MKPRKCFRSLLMLMASCTLLLSMSCQSSQDETIVPEGQRTITFSVTNYRQISFDDLSASSTRADIPTDHPSTLAHLLVAVYDAETGQQACPTVQHDYKDFEEKPYEYPQFSMTLPYGHYRLLVLGYSGQKACTISSPSHISWEENYVPNTFLYCEELTLNEDSEPSKDITLKHVVAAIHLTAADATPTQLQKMRFISTGGGTVLNAMTGFVKENTGRTFELSVPNNVAEEGLWFMAYFFLPEEQITTNYTVQAFGKNDVLINEKHFNDVPLRINYLTEWKGKLFEASDDEPDGEKRAFYIEWDTQWAGELHIDQ